MFYSQSVLALNIFKSLKILTKLQKYGLKYAHIDFADEIYAKNFGANYEMTSYLVKLFPNIEFDAHLMTKNPFEKIEKLVQIGIKTIFIPIEFLTLEQLIFIKKQYPNINFGAMLQAHQEVQDFANIIAKIPIILVMTIDKIGGTGQPLNPKLLEKISQIRSLNSKIKVYSDGGLRKENWDLFEQFNVDVAIGGSIIFSYPNFSDFAKQWGSNDSN
ncbi:ribulose-phosphate 3-epimerase [Mesomycoplasma conjunctivae]|uniref:D-ribulose-5-phosphate 3 epimerase n=1 Tax=Mesomycoplasma conjunctivae (strain ATCC 25834 / NCTC 10147 / HRC/581) TaxID=572263 RepID=C5J5Q4_MESCH|nr:ribulose-phosphate 3-epimerase [Mesomycoplasma conjunctivae]CAT04783.1 D-ribulose-5-phosphate 3 epimerase [Mesomycoplasma conjunctivae]VEU65810.1 ribulose-phosphate 3-epimerase [Mesomycoplasma conjunctivae]